LKIEVIISTKKREWKIPGNLGELLPETFRELLLEHAKYPFRELLPEDERCLLGA